MVDFHGEASSEKQSMGFFCDGRASLVVGTHTHVPTADHQILSGGTAYMTDAGMTGDYDSVIGMQRDEPLRRFTTGISGRFEPAGGVATLSGVAVETDDATGLALKIAPVRLGGRLERPRRGFGPAERVRAGLTITAATRNLRIRRKPLSPGWNCHGPRRCRRSDRRGRGARGGGCGSSIAARLQGIALPGQVVLAEPTRRLLGDVFDVTHLGGHSLKGIAGQASAYVVIGERIAESRFEARAAGACPRWSAGIMNWH